MATLIPGLRNGNRHYYATMMERYGLSIEGHYISPPKRANGEDGMRAWVRTGRDAEMWIDGFISARIEIGDMGGGVRIAGRDVTARDMELARQVE